MRPHHQAEEHGAMHSGGGAHAGHEGMGHGHHTQPAPGETEPPPTFGQHNQMMVGEETIYLSHLPMFMFDPQRHEHSFQVILEVALSGPGNPQATYAADRREHPDVRMYTSRPPDFDEILSVTLVGEPPSALTKEALGRGVRVSIPGRANTPPTRIKAGE